MAAVAVGRQPRRRIAERASNVGRGTMAVDLDVVLTLTAAAPCPLWLGFTGLVVGWAGDTPSRAKNRPLGIGRSVRRRERGVSFDISASAATVLTTERLAVVCARRANLPLHG